MHAKKTVNILESIKKSAKIRDLPLAAVITTTLDQEPDREVNQGLTIFLYEPSDELNRVIAAYSTNQVMSLPILDLFNNFRRLRQLMYDTRDGTRPSRAGR